MKTEVWGVQQGSWDEKIIYKTIEVDFITKVIIFVYITVLQSKANRNTTYICTYRLYTYLPFQITN